MSDCFQPRKIVPVGILLALLCLSSCKKDVASTPAAMGQQIYMSRCIACHNSDPKKVGSIGPDVWGSSRELLEARVVNGTYPEGYSPKKSTALMQAMPDLKSKIDFLHAFLNQ